MNLKKVIYCLTIEDIQTVAFEELDRELSKKEVEKIIDTISDKINWYDAIAYAIYENIKSEI